MRTITDSESELFELIFEDESEGFNSEFMGEAWEGEVNQSDLDYIRWVQQSLNKILGLRLAVDGIAGVQTRSAIRSFQQSRKLTVDGIVGPQTERALIAAGAGNPPSSKITKPDAVLDRFDFNQTELKPFHNPILQQIATRISQSFETGQPIFTVYLVGHTDPVGTITYNQNLGIRRGLAVRRELARLLEQRKKGLSYKVLILVQSKGESEPVDTSQSEDAKAKNRRVEVLLSTKKLKQLRPPTVIELPPIIIEGTPPQPTQPQPPTTPPQPACNTVERDRRINECIDTSKQCVIDAHIQLGISLAACLSVPVCNAAAMANYLLNLRKCRDALLACNVAAERDTNCQR
jgi:outer membrane protein OmpA-like peptidoglycan-associated protein